jgi:hypothetical protein
MSLAPLIAGLEGIIEVLTSGHPDVKTGSWR